MPGHATVGVGEGQPLGTALDHPRRPQAPGDADVAGLQFQGMHAVAAGDARAGVDTAIEHHQHLHRQPSPLGVCHGLFDRSQAAPQPARFVVRGDDDGDHGQISSRSTTLG